MEDNIFNVEQYTDAEIFNMLDLVNPTDRELEAKIIQLIHKYNAMNNESGKKFTQFFKDIYNHFFYDLEEDDNNQEPLPQSLRTMQSPSLPLRRGVESPWEATAGIVRLNDAKPEFASPKGSGEPLGAYAESFTTIPSYETKIPKREGFQESAEKQITKKEGFQEGSETQKPPPLDETKKKDPLSKVTPVNQLDYTKDSLNPLLKQTIKRIISIDSQYRDKHYPLSTEFTFNLSEPLKDVVALRLYSVQIPYTWYTISNSYGGNFFYLKGISPGIDNGNFDYQIDISSGNYLPRELETTINSRIQKLKSKNTDVNFDYTEINYNSASSTSTFNIHVENIFNETNYQVTFNNPINLNKYPLSIGSDYKQLRYSTNYTSTLSAFLGFNYDSYCPNTIYSKRNIPSIQNTSYIDNTDPLYYIDASNNTNNYFTIYQYIGPKPLKDYDPSYANVTFHTKIQISLETGNYTRTKIFNDINSQIQNNPYLINSSLKRTDISGNYSDLSESRNQYIIDNNGNSFYSLTIQLNKKTTPNYINSKIAIVFPIETDPKTRIWVYDQTISNNCFQFANTINELNTMKAETNILQSTYSITKNPYFVLKCITPGYDCSRNIGGTYNYTDISYNIWNDYKVSIPNNELGYNLNNYLNVINIAINLTNINITPNLTQNVFNNMGLIDNLSVNNNLLFRFDINKRFNINSYSIDLSNTILYSLFGLGASVLTNLNPNDPQNPIIVLDSSTTIDLTNSIQQFTSRVPLTFGYTIPSNNLIKILPNGNDTNKNALPWIVPFIGNPNISYGLELIVQLINNSFNNFTDNGYSYPLIGSQLTYIPHADGSITMNLNIIINKILTQNDYQVQFYDSSCNTVDTSNNYIHSSWKTDFNLSQTYNLIDYSNNQYSYTDIVINNISSNNFVIKDDTYITISPITSGLSVSNGLNTNIDPVTITIPATTTYYTIGQIKTIINDGFNSIPLLNGSYLDYTSDLSNNTYVSLLININKVYTASDYKLVFYDLNSFVKCFVGSSSVRNVTWDSTLGWILGFHNKIEYFLSDYINPDSNIAVLTGDTTISSILYNYFLIVLDDYTQSHINDGLITLTPQENDIQVPPYAPESSLQCDVNNKKTFTGNFSNTNGKNLTQKQIYSANQIYQARQNKIKNYSLGPFIQDIFGFIPMKVSGLPNGSSYVEFGGTLQNQERMYFGPVNIHRMTIKLMNDKGDIVDLNNSNWSFSFICEQLYQQNTI
jgi:hypothetical protein